MCRQRGGDELRLERRAHRLQHAFAMQRFERRRVGLDDIDLVPAGLLLGEHALQDLVGRGAPHAHLHAVPCLEGGVEHCHVLDRERCIEVEARLLARTFREARRAVRTAVERDVGNGIGCRSERNQRRDQPVNHLPY